MTLFTSDLPLALAGGSFIFLGVIVLAFFGVVYGYFTVTGSGIEKRPSDGLDGAPGSAAPSDESGHGRSPDRQPGDGDGDPAFSSHGTR